MRVSEIWLWERGWQQALAQQEGFAKVGPHGLVAPRNKVVGLFCKRMNVSGAHSPLDVQSKERVKKLPQNLSINCWNFTVMFQKDHNLPSYTKQPPLELGLNFSCLFSAVTWRSCQGHSQNYLAIARTILGGLVFFPLG